MPHYDIEGLRAKQAKFAARTASVIQTFRPFRDGFLSLLSQFSEEAAAQGLEGGTPVTSKSNHPDFIEYSITLNHYPLLILSTTEALTLDPDSQELACRIFIYGQDHPDATPLVDISFHEKSSKLFASSVQWFTTEGPRPLGGAFPFGPAGAFEEGREVAETILGLMYRFERSWREKPPLYAIRMDRSAARPLGFRTGRGSA